MTQVSYELPGADVIELPTGAGSAQPAAATAQLSWWQGSLLSVVALAGIYGVAIGEMVLLGVIIHSFDPTKVLNIFTALHNQWVVGVLLGITVLWLLPPHPWAARVIAPLSREQPAGAGETGGGGSITALSHYQGRASSHRPGED